MSSSLQRTEKRHLLTVLLEDYFHVGAFNELIQRGQWYRFETRFERNTLEVLDLLDRFNVKATFFVLGWIADHQPDIVREVARRGHEIASRGLYRRHHSHPLSPAEFRDDLLRARDVLERVSGRRIQGFRAAHRWTHPADLWALDVLAEEGYAYDSSLAPIARAFRHEPWRQFAHKHEHAGRELWEFPISTANLLGWRLPIAGGNFFRQIPHTLLKHAVEHWHQAYDSPFVMYTHVWEFDPEQPVITGASSLARMRHYRNLDKMRWVVEEYLRKYRFTSVADYLGLDAAPLPDQSAESVNLAPLTDAADHALPVAMSAKVAPISHANPTAPAPVTVVVPCYNEATTLQYLGNTLKSLEAALAERYSLRFVFVDDGSSDETFDVLQRLFGASPNCSLLKHESNLGVAASILDGVRHAQTEIVCSIDCDCTYDPHELARMIPLLTAGVSMVTASPYHPRGVVRNVPGWRLALSKGASALYRRVLRQRLSTYTSCFRVYRRSAVGDLRLREPGFLGVAEMLGRLDLRGARIVEHPATLEVRLFGQSKMKVARTVLGHLRLLSRLFVMRARGSDGAPRRADAKATDDASVRSYHSRPVASPKS
jgi:polysaccharide deacetylase family protein (PEP-CTERM system associated)